MNPSASSVDRRPSVGGEKRGREETSLLFSGGGGAARIVCPFPLPLPPHPCGKEFGYLFIFVQRSFIWEIHDAFGGGGREKRCELYGKETGCCCNERWGIRIKRNALFTFVARYGIPNSDNFLCPTFPFFPGNTENKNVGGLRFYILFCRHRSFRFRSIDERTVFFAPIKCDW